VPARGTREFQSSRKSLYLCVFAPKNIFFRYFSGTNGWLVGLQGAGRRHMHGIINRFKFNFVEFKTMTTTSFYTLFESASGYALFSVLENEEIGSLLQEV
jgi:hypothetical protein